MITFSNAELDKYEKEVEASFNYGKEYELVKKAIQEHPLNDDLLGVAMKVAIVDLTNSTQLTNYKSKISLYDISNIILGISDFDERLAKGDVELISELARKCKDFRGKNEGVNLFSFASKYCCYHNVYAYNRDDYSIFDNVLSEHLYEYSIIPIGKTTPELWRTTINYKAYNDFIGELLDKMHITTPMRRRKFDHFVWWQNRKEKIKQDIACSP